MRATRLTALVVGAALTVLAACGGESDGGGDKQGIAEKRPASSIRCLELSVLSPERYGTRNNGDPPREVRALVTPGARALAILTGTEQGADVIEYATTAEASHALDEARASKGLAGEKVSLTGRTLFLDYSRDTRVQNIVQACARSPEKPPPAA